MGDVKFDQGEEDLLNTASRCLQLWETTWWLSVNKSRVTKWGIRPRSQGSCSDVRVPEREEA